MTRPLARLATATAVLGVALASAPSGWTATAFAGVAAASKAGTAASPAAPAPFAKVYLALKGCTSCAHCRTTIRQMAKGSAKGGETHVDAGQVEVLYRSARVVPLRDVIHSLAENRLHDLDLVDVLFEGRGTIAKNPNGTLRFTLTETGQSFPVSVAPNLARPADGRAVRLVAVVNGWRGKGDLTLTAREVRPAA